MRVLFDECFPRALRDDMPRHQVKTVAEMGWAGVKNGELLRLAAAQFDLLLTSNDVAFLRPLMSAVLAAIGHARPGVVTHVGD